MASRGPASQLQAVGSPLTFRVGELAEGGQRDDGVGDGVHQVQHAADVAGAAGLDAADGVRLLLEPENRAQWAMGRLDPALTETGPGRAAGGQVGLRAHRRRSTARCSLRTPWGPSTPWTGPKGRAAPCVGGEPGFALVN